MRVSSSTWAGAPAAASSVAARWASTSTGWTSRARRWSVQSPPRSTFVGTPGRGTMEPSSAPPPANSNEVT